MRGEERRRREEGEIIRKQSGVLFTQNISLMLARVIGVPRITPWCRNFADGATSLGARVASTSTCTLMVPKMSHFSTMKEVGGVHEEPVIKAGKRGIPQSQWKMNFLVTLIRNAWVPDALAQLKFSPKPRCEDVSKIVKRAAAVAGIYHGGNISQTFYSRILFYINLFVAVALFT